MCFVSVCERLKDDSDTLEIVFAAPQDCWWGIEIRKRGIFYGVRQAPGQKQEDVKDIKVSEKWRLLLRNEVVVRAIESEMYYADKVKDDNMGYNWFALDYSLEQVTSEPLARALDSIVVELEMRYLK